MDVFTSTRSQGDRHHRARSPTPSPNAPRRRGGSPDGRAVTIADTGDVPAFPPGWTKDADVVDAPVRTFSAVIERVRERVDELGPVDAVTQDLLIGLTAEAEKQSCMFRAENRV